MRGLPPWAARDFTIGGRKGDIRNTLNVASEPIDAAIRK
jgi:hypothetical protein